jgi:phytoene/squalene synthetase
MRADLFKQDYKSDEETMEYVHGSAEVVGLMCLKIFVDGDENHYNELEGPAKKLGSAFQKVNFLRDLKADKEKLERSYFADITHGTLDEDVKSSLIEEIDQEFLEARKGIDKLPGRSRFAVLVAYLYYRQLLRKLKRTPARMIMNKRIRVNNSRKLILLFNAYITYKSKSA